MDARTGPASQSPRLRQTVERLELGDWRAATALLNPPQPLPAEAEEELAPTLKDLADCQIHRATGDPGLALDVLTRVAVRLARQSGIPPVYYRDGIVSVRLIGGSTAANQEPPLSWLVTRLAWREQTELLELRARARRKEASDVAGIAVLATVEYLSWVEFDPWTPTRPSEDEFGDVNRHPATWFAKNHHSELQAMSTSLRQLARPTSGGVSRPVIYDAGGYRGLRRSALAVLSDLDRPPWRTPAWDAHDVPNRAGAELAWQYAQSWARYVKPG
jgi:hypothetical protein